MRLMPLLGYQCAYLTTVYSRYPVLTMAGLMGTDKLQAEESEAYFRVLIEAAPDAMVIVDDAGEIAIVNGQTETMFGYDRKEMLGNKIEMLLPDRIRASHVGHRETFAGNPALRPMGVGMELVGQRKDGSTFPLEIVTRMSTREGRIVRIAGLRDVSVRRRLENERRHAEEQLHRAQRAAVVPPRMNPAHPVDRRGRNGGRDDGDTAHYGER